MGMFSLFNIRSEPSQRRAVLRQMITPRGTVFNVIVETEHYTMCDSPENSDSPFQALFDFEWMASQGYFFVQNFPFLGSVLFERRAP